MQTHRIPKRTKKRHGCYVAREQALLACGFESYREYLASHVWNTVRELAFGKHGRKCVKCGEHATEIHHTFYTPDVLLGVELDALKPVCDKCHRNAEWSGGEKMTLAQANDRLGVDVTRVGKRIKKRIAQLSKIERRSSRRIERPAHAPEIQKQTPNFSMDAQTVAGELRAFIAERQLSNLAVTITSPHRVELHLNGEWVAVVKPLSMKSFVKGDKRFNRIPSIRYLILAIIDRVQK